MKTTSYNNRTVVTFTAPNNIYNDVIKIAKKHNAQDTLYDNNRGGSVLSYNRSHRIKKKQTFGGSVTFHSHSCDHEKAAKELVAFLEDKGLFLNGELKEVIITHRKNGTPYKTPQHYIVSK